MKGRRIESVELLRCSLMFCIVLHHSFHWGIFGAEKNLWTLLFESLIVWHVDAFIGISGWFGMRFKPSKVIRLIGIMAWTSLLSVGYLFFFDRSHFSIRDIGIRGGWFGATYLMFLFVVPFVDAAIDRMQRESPKVIIFVWGALACAYGLTWFPRHFLLPFSPSGVSGQSLFLFFFIYLTMRLVKLYASNLSFFKMPILTGGVVFLLVSALCGGVGIVYRWSAGMPIEGRNWAAYTSYDAPHVWLFAICLVYHFATRVSVPDWLSRLVILLAPSMFGVYLLHDTTSFGKLLYIGPQKWLMANTSFHPVMVILISAVCCFVLCLIADVVRRLLFLTVHKHVERVLPLIDERWPMMKVNDNEGV